MVDGTNARGVDSARVTRRCDCFPVASGRVGNVYAREALSLAEPLKPWQSPQRGSLRRRSGAQAPAT